VERQTDAPTEQHQIRESRLSLLSAFYGELAAAQYIVAVNHVNLRGDALISHSVHPRPIQQDSLRFFFEQCPQIVYQHNVDKVGVLGANLSFAVVKAYSRISQIDLVLPKLQGRLDQEQAEELSASEVDEFALYFKTASDDITDAITRIKSAWKDRVSMSWVSPEPPDS
jgi:hypothetical protein